MIVATMPDSPGDLIPHGDARLDDWDPWEPAQAARVKARHLRPKDEADFAATLPLLEASERRWLADALALVHPGHAWLERVGVKAG